MWKQTQNKVCLSAVLSHSSFVCSLIMSRLEMCRVLVRDCQIFMLHYHIWVIIGLVNE